MIGIASACFRSIDRIYYAHTRANERGIIATNGNKIVVPAVFVCVYVFICNGNVDRRMH